MEVVEEEVKALHDDDSVNPYRVFPDAAKMILVPDVVVATPATAEMEAVGEVLQGMGDVDVESTFGTTLTAPLLVPTTRTGREEDETKVFNAVTPLVPAAVEFDELQRFRLLLLVAKQSAGKLLDVMSDPA